MENTDKTTTRDTPTAEIRHRIREALAFEPTREQEAAIEAFTSFLADQRGNVAMVLRGAAGTGKTTLAAAFIKALLSLKQRIMLLAPTGRAAKVLSLHAGLAAYTIHRRIYRQKSIDAGMGGFSLNNNLHTDTLFVIDEASMVANQSLSADHFGSGCLLDDLVQYVYGGRNCRMLLIGDHAQLPPVGEEESPALMRGVLEGYGLNVHEATLNEVLRQSLHSGILFNATSVRRMLDGGEPSLLPTVRFEGFADIRRVPGDELIEQLATSYSEVGLDETMVVTRSNKRTGIYNRGIRSTVLGREEELSSGDMLMVVRNNYHWIEKTIKEERAANPNAPLPPLNFIANGDRARVHRVRNVREFYGFRFADLTLQFPDYEDYEITVTTLLDTLSSEAPSLTPEQNERLFNAVMEDYADIPRKADRLKALRADPYYNALQVKFAYAVTCHKAQGGQWAHVYVDQGYMTDDMLTPDYLHWLYTAFTRATEKLFLVNWPKTQTAHRPE